MVASIRSVEEHGVPDDSLSTSGQAQSSPPSKPQATALFSEKLFKNLAANLELLSQYCRNERHCLCAPFARSAQDESRFGLKTIAGRLITACGIKPIGQFYGCSKKGYQTRWGITSPQDTQR